MSRLKSFFNTSVIPPVVSTRSVLGLLQISAFAVSFGILYMGLYGVTKFATTPFDVFVGVLAVGTLALALVILALVLPLSMRCLKEPVH